MKAQLAFMFMMLINALSFMSQQALTDVANQEQVIAPTMYSPTDLVKSMNNGQNGNWTISNESYNSFLPSSSPSIGENLQAFLFPLQVFLNWLGTVPLLIVAFFTAFPNFIAGMAGIPPALVFIISTVWYIAGVLCIILTFVK
jgi:hypothetical protein